jgi:hypothetical protein
MPELGYEEPVRVCVACASEIEATARGVDMQALNACLAATHKPNVKGFVAPVLLAAQPERERQPGAVPAPPRASGPAAIDTSGNVAAGLRTLSLGDGFGVCLRKRFAILTPSGVLALTSVVGAASRGAAAEAADVVDARQVHYQFIRTVEEIAAAEDITSTLEADPKTHFGVEGVRVHWTTGEVTELYCFPEVLLRKHITAVQAAQPPAARALLEAPTGSGAAETKTPDAAAAGSDEAERWSRPQPVPSEHMLLSLHAQSTLVEARKAREIQRWKELSALRRTTVSWGQPKHVQLMEKLWATFLPTSPSEASPTFPGVRSPVWKELGFQGDDPLTDFRSMGELSLHCLIYVAETYPANVKAIREAEAGMPDVSRHYPLAAAIINCVSMVSEFLLTDAVVSAATSVAELPPVPAAVLRDGLADIAMPRFEETVAFCILALDRLWHLNRASYFDFPKILASVKAALLRFASARPVSFVVLRERMTSASWS